MAVNKKRRKVIRWATHPVVLKRLRSARPHNDEFTVITLLRRQKMTLGHESRRSNAPFLGCPDQQSPPPQSSRGYVWRYQSPEPQSAIDLCSAEAGLERTQISIPSWSPKDIPIHGYSQPSNGDDFAIGLAPMTKKPKKSKILTAQHRHMRQTLSDNLSALIEVHFPASKYPTRSAREQAAAKAAGLTWSTIQRILNQQVGTTTDTLADLASVFHISPADLLTANFAQTERRAG